MRRTGYAPSLSWAADRLGYPLLIDRSRALPQGGTWARGTDEHRGAAQVVNTTRDRILDSSAELFRRQGYAGTGVKQIVASANAPFGSLYHFFPGGKEQLGAETLRSSGA